MSEWTRIKASKYAGVCNGCGAPYAVNEQIFVCEGKYYNHLDCLEAKHPGATEKKQQQDKKVSTNDEPTNERLVNYELLVMCADTLMVVAEQLRRYATGADR